MVGSEQHRSGLRHVLRTHDLDAPEKHPQQAAQNAQDDSVQVPAM
jgi:hypothetical protein